MSEIGFNYSKKNKDVSRLFISASESIYKSHYIVLFKIWEPHFRFEYINYFLK